MANSHLKLTEAIELKSHGGDRRSPKAINARLQAHGGDCRDQDAVGILKIGTNSADYIKARLRRDHPEIAEQLERGEHRFARAAAIKAGDNQHSIGAHNVSCRSLQTCQK